MWSGRSSKLIFDFWHGITVHRERLLRFLKLQKILGPFLGLPCSTTSEGMIHTKVYMSSAPELGRAEPARLFKVTLPLSSDLASL